MIPSLSDHSLSLVRTLDPGTGDQERPGAEQQTQAWHPPSSASIPPIDTRHSALGRCYLSAHNLIINGVRPQDSFDSRFGLDLNAALMVPRVYAHLFTAKHISVAARMVYCTARTKYDSALCSPQQCASVFTLRAAAQTREESGTQGTAQDQHQAQCVPTRHPA